MKQLKLSVEMRKRRGTTASGRMRKEGLIPAVIYGPSGTDAIKIKQPDFRMLMRESAGSAALLEVTNEEGVSKLAIIQDIQRHPTKDHFMHVDLLEVSADKEMHATVPVHAKGEAYGVKNENATLDIVLHTLDIYCLPKDLPESIDLDVTELRSGQSIHINEIPAISGVRFGADPETVVISCAEARKVVEAEEEAAEDAEAGEAAEGEKTEDAEKKEGE